MKSNRILATLFFSLLLIVGGCNSKKQSDNDSQEVGKVTIDKADWQPIFNLVVREFGSRIDDATIDQLFTNLKADPNAVNEGTERAGNGPFSITVEGGRQLFFSDTQDGLELSMKPIGEQKLSVTNSSNPSEPALYFFKYNLKANTMEEIPLREMVSGVDKKDFYDAQVSQESLDKTMINFYYSDGTITAQRELTDWSTMGLSDHLTYEYKLLTWDGKKYSPIKSDLSTTFGKAVMKLLTSEYGLTAQEAKEFIDGKITELKPSNSELATVGEGSKFVHQEHYLREYYMTIQEYFPPELGGPASSMAICFLERNNGSNAPYLLTLFNNGGFGSPTVMKLYKIEEGEEMNLTHLNPQEVLPNISPRDYFSAEELEGIDPSVLDHLILKYEQASSGETQQKAITLIVELDQDFDFQSEDQERLMDIVRSDYERTYHLTWDGDFFDITQAPMYN